MGVEPVNGNVEPNKGTLYSLEKGGQPIPHVSSVTISNGLAWDVKEKKFYYIDSPERKIVQYDYDLEKGTISMYFKTSLFSHCYVLLVLALNLFIKEIA